ncbi:GLPGLI family protein [Maribacter sp. 2308TA10-17]|uniref:GLPGLI family protein n=1 Tax=Maribacter sp. 2308TA10-17 TaxID=3386276 RepID=UPI0039BC3A5C
MKKFGMVVILFITVHMTAQDFAGLAIYKTDMKMEIKLDSASTSADQMDLVQQQLRFAMQKEFQLSFTKSESNWKEQESLDKPASGGAGVQIQVVGMGGGSDGLLYKNTKNKKTKESSDAFGKLFLISGELEPFEWEMTSETKQIGRYTCYKAIAKREITQTKISEVNGEMEEKEEKKIQTTTAWYTTEIPVNHGPDMYWGLPGLILEVNDGSRIMICTKVVLNPDKEVVIEVPSKGKKVTEEEYEEIMREQSEKMHKMYGGGKKKGKNSSSFSISIEN